MDLAKYHADVRRVAEALPPQPIYYLVSIENSDRESVSGRVVDIPSARQAAVLIVGKTHELAKPEQIERFHADMKKQEEALAAIEMDRKGQLAMPKELQDLVRLATQAVQPADKTKKEK